ncbi:MAG: glutathione S-transferase [Pseudomonadota bacterium]
MTYELAIGDRLFSSWSLRGWLAFAKFNIPVKVRHARMYNPAFDTLRAEFAPTRTVPAVRIDSDVVWDSLAIAETLAERHPEACFWPKDITARAAARSITAEMHSGFTALRSNCPMDLRHRYLDYAVPDDVRADVDRIETLWAYARTYAGCGPWLFGAYSVADLFYAPVAMRFATYGLVESQMAQDYVAQHLSDQTFRQWRAMGFAENFQQTVYDRDLTKADWPGPKPRAARAVDGTASENTHCPYSGDPVTHFLEMDGRKFGFCNAFCRDKTLADPEAWPAFLAMVNET